MLRRNLARMVDVLTWLITVTVTSTEVLRTGAVISTGNGTSGITRAGGSESAGFSSSKSRGAQSVCVRTSIPQRPSAITLSHTVATASSFSKGRSNLCASLITRVRQIKRWGGVAKMFNALSCKAGVASITKKIPNVKISGQLTAIYPFEGSYASP